MRHNTKYRRKEGQLRLICLANCEIDKKFRFRCQNSSNSLGSVYVPSYALIYSNDLVKELNGRHGLVNIIAFYLSDKKAIFRFLFLEKKTKQNKDEIIICERNRIENPNPIAVWNQCANDEMNERRRKKNSQFLEMNERRMKKITHIHKWQQQQQ